MGPAGQTAPLWELGLGTGQQPSGYAQVLSLENRLPVVYTVFSDDLLPFGELA